MKKNVSKENYLVSKIKKFVFVIVIIGVVILISFAGKYLYNIYTASQVSNALNNVNIYSTSDNQDFSENVLKLKELKNKNNDIVGWIKIDETKINYPVLQTIDNEFYTQHDYLKNVSDNGSIVLDKDYKFDPAGMNMFIFGVNKNNYVMFSELLQYKNESFYNEHKNIDIITENNEETYKVVSVFESKIYAENETGFKYYEFANIGNEEQFMEYTKNIKEMSLFKSDEELKYGDQLLTLSTNSYHTDNGRFVVVAKKIK